MNEIEKLEELSERDLKVTLEIIRRLDIVKEKLEAQQKQIDFIIKHSGTGCVLSGRLKDISEETWIKEKKEHLQQTKDTVK